MRIRAKRLFPIALSPEALASALGMGDPRHVRNAIKTGELPVYERGKARRILVEDAVRWIKTYWKRG
jgi:hypothetical protein